MKGVNSLIPGTSNYVTFQGTKDFADVIKLRILQQGDYPILSRWALNVITNVL